MTTLQTTLERADLRGADRDIVVYRNAPVRGDGGDALLLNILV
jgi:hypothetical protein